MKIKIAKRYAELDTLLEQFDKDLKLPVEFRPLKSKGRNVC